MTKLEKERGQRAIMVTLSTEEYAQFEAMATEEERTIAGLARKILRAMIAMKFTPVKKARKRT